MRMAPSVLDKLNIPWTYCWSPTLLPKPDDWRSNIDVSGFYFLDNDISYAPPSDLQAFLAAGPAPIYIGFGSVPFPNADQVTGECVVLNELISDMLFAAIDACGVRAIVSAGWAGLGKNRMVPSNIYVMTGE